MMIVFYVSGSKRKGEAQMDFKKVDKYLDFGMFFYLI